MRRSSQLYSQVLSIIGCANGNAGRNLGCENAVRVIRQSELLRTSKVPHEWEKIVEEVITGRHLSALPGVIQMSRQLSHHTCEAIRQRKELLVLGGDHSCAIGTWSGVATALRPEGEIGLIWVDAHLDAHRPETSETGNIHGMPVAHLLGFGDKNLCRVGDRLPKIRPENLVMVGIRSFEPEEQDLLEKLGVRIFYIDEVDRRGIVDVMQEAHHLVNRGTIGFGMSIDIDGFRVSDAPAVGTPENGGIHAHEFLHALLELNLRKMIAAEIVEFLPQRDDQDRTSERLVVNLMETIFLTKFFQQKTTEQIVERMTEKLATKTPFEPNAYAPKSALA